LKDHADAPPHQRGIHLRGIKVLVEQSHPALDARARRQVVHAVQGAQKSGFAASARPNDGGDGLGRDLQADIGQDLVRAEPDMEMLDVKSDARSLAGWNIAGLSRVHGW
jgi:hypothetical protein